MEGGISHMSLGAPASPRPRTKRGRAHRGIESPGGKRAFGRHGGGTPALPGKRGLYRPG